MSKFISLVALLCALPAVSVAQAPETIEVSGVVVDETTGAPLGGVAIHVRGTDLGTLTDAEGRYHVREVPNRKLAVAAQRIGYIPELRELWVCAPMLSPGDGCLSPPPADQELRFNMRPTPAPVLPAPQRRRGPSTARTASGGHPESPARRTRGDVEL